MTSNNTLRENSAPFCNTTDAIQKLRLRISNALSKFPAYDTDYSLLRWLSAENYNVEATALKLESALYKLSAIGAFTENINRLEDAQNVFPSITAVAEYFPGGIMGVDRDGNVICIQPMGRVRPRNLIPTARVSELYRALILECEASLALVRNEEKKRGHKVGVIIITDLAELSISSIYMPALRIYMNALQLLQSLFPGSIIKIYVINAPSAIGFLYRIARQALSKFQSRKGHSSSTGIFIYPVLTFQNTLDLVEFLGDNWKDALKERIGEENILPFWGGTKQANSPTDSIRMGGEIDDRLRDEQIASLKRIPKEQLTTVCVSARRDTVINLDVSQPRSVLSWYFTVASGDIDFWISYGSHEVWPRFRVSTDFVAEYGEICCAEKGIYTVHFDNTHGTIWSKRIDYMFQVNNKNISPSSSLPN
ncbi:unnamed protein product [Anisakis simplex]|uniref:CRAL-TRIO domain-containing protein n=1 Tax=Anisakis simplex TaxID=6269 RepID=A0A158PPE3_ANISI|nr:unnamed protein product [Anisakis simplex]